MKSLPLARSLAAETIQKAQGNYKMQYDHKANRNGEWVLIKFPHEESGKQRKFKAMVWPVLNNELN